MKLLLSLVLLIFTAYLHASEEPYLIPITRDGMTHTMVAYNSWSGEYPEPVIRVQPSQSKWNKVMGYPSLRNTVNKKECTIKTGTYHPWSEDKISLISYYSIEPKISYLAQSDIMFEGQKFKKGDKLDNEVYLSEGFCSYVLNGKKERLRTNCIGEDTHFKITKYPTHPSEQWLYLSCKEGYKVFVQDSDLLSQPNVTEGQMYGYGEVTKK